MKGFAVFDFETTGLSARRNDRVVEVGVVLMGEDGEIEGEFSTLLNPGRDLGPSHIHHIYGRDVADAPGFGDVAPTLLEIMADRVLVAHNAQFDYAFLLAELERCGIETSSINASVLCTMKLSKAFLPGGGRSLSACCDAYDITISKAHEALSDARATAALLNAYRSQDSQTDFWMNLMAGFEDYSWPQLEAKEFTAKLRGGADVEGEEPFLLSKISRLPGADATEDEMDFLALLDRVLADEIVTLEEAQELLEAVARAEVSPARLQELREMYFDDLARLVWEDGLATDDELRRLDRVAAIMKIGPDSLARAKSGTDLAGTPAVLADPTTPESITLLEGDFVVLTGESDQPREHLERLLADRGVIVWPSVTKKVKLVIAADVSSVSGKARKAREYGIPIASVSMLMNALAE